MDHPRTGQGGPPHSRDAPTFLADAMLGRLARWLRLLGYDVLFENRQGDDDIARRALAEGRHVLTRDRGLAGHRFLRSGPRPMSVTSEDLDEQLTEVLDRFDPEGGHAAPFSRCSSCGGSLESATLEEVEGEIPPFAARTSDRFARCARCARVYWEGTHGPLAASRVARHLAGRRRS